MERVRTAVVGVGHFGGYHSDKYSANPRSEFVAVADRDIERASEIAERHGVRAVSDYRELIGSVDAVSVAVPTPAHHEVAGFFLDNGVHVLVEKPIASSVEEADDLIERARATGAVLQVGHLERVFARQSGLLETVERPLYMEAIRVAPFGPRGSDVSVVLDLMIHDIDLVAALARSPIERVDAVGAPILTEHEDIANTRLHFQNGCVATITASRVSFKSERRLRIFQTDCLVSVDMMERKMAVVRKTAPASGQTGPGHFSLDEREFEASDALATEIDAFLTSVADGEPPIVSGEDGRDALALGNLIIESLQAHTDRMRAHLGEQPGRD